MPISETLEGVGNFQQDRFGKGFPYELESAVVMMIAALDG
jgi:hypothetical protein